MTLSTFDDTLLLALFIFAPLHHQPIHYRPVQPLSHTNNFCSFILNKKFLAEIRLDN
jgi:hypothetical protein